MTFGCQANERDSETIAGILEALDLFETKELEEADLLVVNTCSVRQKSEDKVYGLGKIIPKLKHKNSNFKVIISGCMVGSVTGERKRYEFDELKKRTPFADAYINPSQIREFPKILSELNIIDDWVDKALNVKEKRNLTFAPGENSVPNKKHAFVNISTGCDNFCTFCVVPYARGKEISRTKEEILKEIQALLNVGYTQITLCGQNVNSWGLGTTTKFEIRAGSDFDLPFAHLLQEVNALPKIEKISFISSNPFDFTTSLIEAMKLPKISRYLHIAVQSGSNGVLKRMNRRHTVEEFTSLLNKIKKEIPEIEIGTDIIVGFPGETNEDFNKTVELFKKIKFNVAYISIYSVRKGTPAEKFFKDDVSIQEKKRRHAELTGVFNECRKSGTVLAM